MLQASAQTVDFKVGRHFCEGQASDVEIDGEFHFERRMFGSNPEQLRSLAAWLLEQEVEEVVMESTAQYWRPVWGALERYWKPFREKARRRKAEVRNVASSTSAVQSRTVGAQAGFPGCRAPGEATGGSRIDSELCARCRATSLADSHAQEVPIDVGKHAYGPRRAIPPIIRTAIPASPVRCYNA